LKVKEKVKDPTELQNFGKVLEFVQASAKRRAERIDRRKAEFRGEVGEGKRILRKRITERLAEGTAEVNTKVIPSITKEEFGWAVSMLLTSPLSPLTYALRNQVSRTLRHANRQFETMLNYGNDFCLNGGATNAGKYFTPYMTSDLAWLHGKLDHPSFGKVMLPLFGKKFDDQSDFVIYFLVTPGDSYEERVWNLCRGRKDIAQNYARVNVAAYERQIAVLEEHPDLWTTPAPIKHSHVLKALHTVKEQQKMSIYREIDDIWREMSGRRVNGTARKAS